MNFVALGTAVNEILSVAAVAIVDRRTSMGYVGVRGYVLYNTP